MKKMKQLEEIMDNSRFLPRGTALYTTDGMSFAEATKTNLQSLSHEESGKMFIGYLAEQSGEKIPLNGESGAFGMHLLKGLTRYAVKEGLVNSSDRATYNMAPYLALVGALAARPDENMEVAEAYCAKPSAGLPLDKVVDAATAVRNEVRKKVAQYVMRHAQKPELKVVSDSAAA